VFERYREIQQRREAGDSEVGFTLIELLIVIIVLGILAAIVIFSLTGVTGQSEAAACASDAKTVETAVSAYYAENNDAYPAAWSDLTAGPPTQVHGPFLRAQPTATVAQNGYLITLVPSTGEVDVTTSAVPTATNFDTAAGQAACSGIS
jgi:prepilin-type N-terminal cleavage/methylation domain-containing protein